MNMTKTLNHTIFSQHFYSTPTSASYADDPDCQESLMTFKILPFITGYLTLLSKCAECYYNV